MKRIAIYLIGIISLISFNSCESLDLEVRTTTDANMVRGRYADMKAMNASLYSRLPYGFAYVGGSMMAGATDEAEYTIETSSVQKYNTGSWSQLDNPNDVWGTYYTAIRWTYDFLSKVDYINLESDSLNPAQINEFKRKKAEIRRWKYEARLLKAFYYFELVKRYGGVPIIEGMMDLDTDYASLKRDSLATCIRYIVNECDTVIKNLPWWSTTDFQTTDFGRVTKGTAMALKSRVLLYAASDLFNTPSVWASGYANKELISMDGGDSNQAERTLRWKAAADAAKALIDSAKYSLSSSYAGNFNTSNYMDTNKENIFVRRNAASNAFEISNFPIGYNKVTGGTTPSQNLVDAYEVKVDANTAIPFDWSNPVHAANPYNPTGTLGRDPRLNASVVWNNTTFGTSTWLRIVELWNGGKDGKGVINASKTGYYMKKYIDQTIDLELSKTSVHSWVLMRYAEIYLNYAEALNEYDPGNADIKKYVDDIRKRAAMPVLPVGLDQAQMREKIRQERRIEFAFEDHRFWDVRRWLQGTVYFNAPLKGVDITKTGDNAFTYTPIVVENRVFENKMYLFPIPLSELLICKSLVQNPSW